MLFRGDPSVVTSNASRRGMPTGEDAQTHRRRLVRSTAIFGFATGVSRVLGLVRAPGASRPPSSF